MMKKTQLLSPLAVFLLGINSILGSGIFLLAPKIYVEAGSYSLLAILLASLSILVISFSYANMSKLYPENGGAFVYAKDSFGRFAGYLVGMGVWIQGTVTLAAEVAALLTAAKMLAPHLPAKEIGLSIIIILGVISYFGASILTKLDTLTSFVKILIVLVFIAACAWLVRGVHFTDNVVGTGSGGFLSAYGTVFFFYLGFSFLPVNSEKMKNPTKTLPRMLLIVILTSMTIYLMIQAITIGVLGKQVATSVVPAALAFSRLVGPVGIPLIVGAICVSIFGVIITVTFNTPTILATLATDHEDIPTIVAKNNHFGSPSLAILATIIGASALFFFGNYVFLSGLTVFMSFIQYLSTALANVKNKFYWIGLATLVFSLVLLLSFTGIVLISGFAILILLSIVYLFIKEKSRL